MNTTESLLKGQITTANIDALPFLYKTMLSQENGSDNHNGDNLNNCIANATFFLANQKIEDSKISQLTQINIPLILTDSVHFR